MPEYLEICKDLPSAGCTMLAGGTDLIPRYEMGQEMPDYLIDLKKLSELNQITVSEEATVIGALTSIQDIHDNHTLRTEFEALHLASHDFAGAQIRHRGTIGGNICNASPAGDLLPPLYAFDGLLNLEGPDGERILPINEFILGPGRTALKEFELLTSITLTRNGFKSNFQKVGLRQSMAISTVNVAFVYNTEFTHINIAAGAVSPTVVCLDHFTSAFLKDQTHPTDFIQLIDEDISPIDDIRATAKYRTQVLKNLVNQFIKSQMT